jgi:hypothetical protein
MKATRPEVYAALDSERAYQQKWDTSRSSGEEGNGERTLDEFALYIYGYASDLMKCGSHEIDPAKKLEIVRKVGGLCVAALEQHGAPHRTRSHIPNVDQRGAG